MVGLIPFRFIHAADLHLDSPFRGLHGIPHAIREKVRDSTFAALDQLVDTALRESADFVVISGDVYDAADRSLRAQLKLQKAFSRLSAQRIDVFVVHGNHDPLDGRRAKLSWPSSVHVFGSSQVETVTAIRRDGVPCAAVHGISYGTSAVTDNLAAAFSRQAATERPNGCVSEEACSEWGHPGVDRSAELFHIGLLHANVDGDPGHDNYAPCSKSDLLRAGMDYWALGHIHSRRVLHNEPPVVYPGNIQGRSVKETGDKGCYIVDVDESGRVNMTFVSTASLLWLEEELPITGMTTEQHLKDGIEACMSAARQRTAGRPAIIRVVLTGRGPLHAKLGQGTWVDELVDELRDEQAELARQEENGPFVWIESVRMNTGSAVDMDALLHDSGFVGDLLRISRNLKHHGEEEDGFFERALAPLLHHSRASRHVRKLFENGREDLLRAAEDLAAHMLAGDAVGGVETIDGGDPESDENP